ncbi:MAG TPA: N-acetyl-gamma-glutamyl-phosphate reductase [Clostridiales bacterium]|nr:N-acetyl-gamma-glutamyl-phosphate reductase [Clostridiales bacterium]
MKYQVFVDGQAGTTGLKIHERLAGHPHVQLVNIDESKRKNVAAKREIINSVDVVFLCLPDEAARESVSLVDNDRVRIIDASTAHRTDPAWAYGLPELSPAHREQVAGAKRVSVPGCHATGFALSIWPLLARGIVPADFPVTCVSVTGYSGGGRQLIEQYQDPERDAKGAGFESSRYYSLGLSHKHLPEMQVRMGLSFAPLFQPVIGDFSQGLATFIPFHARQLEGVKPEVLREVLEEHYTGQPFVQVMPLDVKSCQGDPYFNPMALNGTNRAEIFVFGNNAQMSVITRLDNLGKGASGAAVQNMNIMLGLHEGIGLE